MRSSTSAEMSTATSYDIEWVLHVMRGRLHAGRINKARRGELLVHAPMGYVRLATGEIASILTNGHRPWYG
jgi:hypothetical protein